MLTIKEMLTRIPLVLTFLVQINCTYSQITIGSKTLETKEEKIEVLKPKPYDSLKDLEFQHPDINFYQYIGLKLYLPPSYPSYNDCFIYPVGGKYYTIQAVGDRYYTIIDILFGNRVDSIIKKINSSEGCLNKLVTFVLKNDAAS